MPKKSKYIDISERKLLLRVFDITVIIVSISIAFFYTSFNYIKVNNNLAYLWFLVLAVYYLLFGEVFQLYNLKISSNGFTVVRSTLITAFVTTIFYVFSPYITPSLPENRLQIVAFFLMLSVPVILWRFLYIRILFSPKYFKTIIVVGHTSVIDRLTELKPFTSLHNIPAYVSNETIEGLQNFHDVTSVDLRKLIKMYPAITEIVISTSGFSTDVVKEINKQLITLFEKGINIKSFETYYEEVTDRIPKEYLTDKFYKEINFSKNEENSFYLFVRRITEIIIATIGLLLLVSVLPLIIIGNLLGNRGPLFYVQERVGFKGDIFKIIKLRSMVKNAESNGAVWAEKNDKRITFFGKFLRRTRLDESPQFFNVLKGDMSIIGPRPERPEFVNELEKDIPFYVIRHIVRPGLTGWAQVNYPYANSFEEQETKLRYDLYYIKERNAFLDFKILIKTITTVLFFRGQ
ncbi:MAG: exopolysaccharide biosynthesis polyprenyl glycosylphosphotransferase [Flavobacteriaceae bacterium]|nr:exopolysaccharide biosynthesis polyprenyl glycosylphosphotransferase [Flavobacteriaceae bacterium]